MQWSVYSIIILKTFGWGYLRGKMKTLIFYTHNSIMSEAELLKVSKFTEYDISDKVFVMAVIKLNKSYRNRVLKAERF